jgi:hypothetical protein
MKLIGSSGPGKRDLTGVPDSPAENSRSTMASLPVGSISKAAQQLGDGDGAKRVRTPGRTHWANASLLPPGYQDQRNPGCQGTAGPKKSPWGASRQAQVLALQAIPTNMKITRDRGSRACLCGLCEKTLSFCNASAGSLTYSLPCGRPPPAAGGGRNGWPPSGAGRSLILLK